MGRNNLKGLEKLSTRLTDWIGTPQSILLHTLLFIGIFSLKFLGADFDFILLILTTAVSLEAIYLAIFIQMTVNRNTESLEEVEEDIEDIQEDVQGLEDDVEDISEDLEGLQEDETREAKTHSTITKIEDDLQKLLNEVKELKKSHHA